MSPLLQIGEMPSGLWTSEVFYFTGSDYFRRLLELAREARYTIRLESYIFELDEVGNEVLEELLRAADRGVKIRLLIDAIGSPEWSSKDFEVLRKRGITVRVFGRPWDLVREAFHLARRGYFRRAVLVLRKLQLRDHRKLALFDSETALLGSSNIGGTFTEWRETTVELRGSGVRNLRQSYIRSWRFAAREFLPHEFPKKVKSIRNNFTRHERRFANREFISRVRESKRRVWLTTAYFHPRPKLLLAFFYALKNRVDLRILVPHHSDIAWFPWLSRTAFAGLLAAGAKIYEYNGPMLHAKTTVFDKSVLVGSRNMNYRSFMHDLELDVELESETSFAELARRFEIDCAGSTELTPTQLRSYAPFAAFVSFSLTPLKRWL